MSITIPVPTSFCDWVWFGIGFCFARGFGKRLDQEIQASRWFRRRGKLTRWILRRLLDFLHHWWIGALLMCYAPCSEVFWFGCGMFLDDLPDIPRRIKEYFVPVGASGA